jgi:Mg-chelatase subunit ChlD
MSIPPEFECPITLAIMTNPVIGDDNQTYERSAIVHWLSDPRNSGRSPITRSVMRIDTLRPNIALKSQIERFLSQNPVTSIQLIPPAFKESPLTLEALTDGSLLNIKVIPPTEGERQPSLIFLLLDISGSTGQDSGAEVEMGARDFTVLDLCKHTIRTIGGILSETDMLCLITYSSSARVALKPTFMTKEGKEILDSIVCNIRPEGNTNIWSALELMDRVASSPEFSNSNIASALLTDGISNMNPGRGVLETFKLYGKPSLYNLSTFGFGYNIDSELLRGIASYSGGAYAFCPDFSMVGTVFINWAATILSSVAMPKKIKILFKEGTVLSLNTGIIQLGQPRSFTIPVTSEIVSIEMEGQYASAKMVEKLPLVDMARFELIQGLRIALETNKWFQLSEIYEKYKDTKASALMSEIQPGGQVMLGSDTNTNNGESYWHKWGQHYIPAYYRAQELQQRMNFKDASLQGYGGELFEEIQRIGDHVFGTISPLEASGSYKSNFNHTARASIPRASLAYGQSPMSLINTPYGGCWAPGSMIIMADGNKKPIEDVRKGDMVWTLSGTAMVEYALELGTSQASQPMVKLGDLWITPWHPVLDNLVWTTPQSLGSISERIMPKVYNLILSRGHVVQISGILSVTLGHGLNRVGVEHSYFGNKKLVLRDLENQPGFAEGRPVFVNLKVKKENNMVVGWYDDV